MDKKDKLNIAECLHGKLRLAKGWFYWGGDGKNERTKFIDIRTGEDLAEKKAKQYPTWDRRYIIRNSISVRRKTVFTSVEPDKTVIYNERSEPLIEVDCELGTRAYTEKLIDKNTRAILILKVYDKVYSKHNTVVYLLGRDGHIEKKFDYMMNIFEEDDSIQIVQCIDGKLVIDKFDK